MRIKSHPMLDSLMKTLQMKEYSFFKLLEVDNPRTVGQSFVGVVSLFAYDGICFRFDSLRSSIVSSIERTNDILTVTTKNSVYKFKLVEKDPNGNSADQSAKAA